jgi:hypothetical protein
MLIPDSQVSRCLLWYQAKVLSVEPEVCELQNNTMASGTVARGLQLAVMAALVCVDTLANRKPHFPTDNTFASYHSAWLHATATAARTENEST